MATAKQFEQSKADKDMTGKPEGSKAEEKADAKEMKGKPVPALIRKRTPGKNKASVI